MKDPEPFHYHLPKCKSCGATNASYAWEFDKDKKRRKVCSIYFSVDNLPKKCSEECKKIVKVEEKAVPVYKVPKLDTEFVESQEFNEDNYLDVNSFSSENQTVIEQPTFDTALDLQKDDSNFTFDTVHENTPESSLRSGEFEIQKIIDIDHEAIDVKGCPQEIFRAECVKITNEQLNQLSSTAEEGEYQSFSDDFEVGIYESPIKELVGKDIRDYSVPIDFYCEDYVRKEGVRSPRKSPSQREPKIVLEPILEESKGSYDDSGLSCDISEVKDIIMQENETKCIDTKVTNTKCEVSSERPSEVKTSCNSVQTAVNVYTEAKTTCVSQEMFKSIYENIFEILSHDAIKKLNDPCVGGTLNEQRVSTDSVSEGASKDVKFMRKSSIESAISSICTKSFDSTTEFERIEEISDVVTNILDRIDYQSDNSRLITAPKTKVLSIFCITDSSIAKANYCIGQDSELGNKPVVINKQNCEVLKVDSTRNNVQNQVADNNIPVKTIKVDNKNQVSDVDLTTQLHKTIDTDVFEVIPGKLMIDITSNFTTAKNQPEQNMEVLEIPKQLNCDHSSNSDSSTAVTKRNIDICLSGNESRLFNNVLKPTSSDEESFVVQTEFQVYSDSSESNVDLNTDLEQEDFSIAKIIQDMELNAFNDTQLTEISEIDFQSTKIVDAILHYIFNEAFFVLGKKIKANKKEKGRKVITVADVEDILFTAKPFWSDYDFFEKHFNESENINDIENDISFLFEENFAKEEVGENHTREIKPDHELKKVELQIMHEGSFESNKGIKQTQIGGEEKQKHFDIKLNFDDNKFGVPRHEEFIQPITNDQITCTILEEIDVTSTPLKNVALKTSHTDELNTAENYIKDNIHLYIRTQFHNSNEIGIKNFEENLEQLNTSFDAVNFLTQAIPNQEDTVTENSSFLMKSNLTIDAISEDIFIERDSTEIAAAILQSTLDKSSSEQNKEHGAKLKFYLNETFILEKSTDDMNTAFVEDKFYSRSSSPNRKTSIFQRCNVSPIRNPSDTFVGEDLIVPYEKDDTILGSPFVKRASVISMSQIEHSGGVKYWISFDENLEPGPVRRSTRRFDDNKIASFVCVDFTSNDDDQKWEVFDKRNVKREGVLLQHFDNTKHSSEQLIQNDSYQQYLDDTEAQFYRNENRLYHSEENIDEFYISETNQDNSLPETSHNNQLDLNRSLFNQSETNNEKSDNQSGTTYQESLVTACSSTDYTTCDSNNTQFETPQKKLLYDSRVDLHTQVRRRLYASWPPFEHTLFYRIISKFRMSESFDPSELDSAKIDNSF